MDSENHILNSIFCGEIDSSRQWQNINLGSYAGCNLNVETSYENGGATLTDDSSIFKNLDDSNENYWSENNQNMDSLNLNSITKNISYEGLSLRDGSNVQINTPSLYNGKKTGFSELSDGNVFSNLLSSNQTENVLPSASLEEISNILQNAINEYSMKKNDCKYQISKDNSSNSLRLRNRASNSETTESITKRCPINQEQNFQSLDNITTILHDFIDETNCSTSKQNTFFDTASFSDVEAKSFSRKRKDLNSISRSSEKYPNPPPNFHSIESKFSNKRPKFESNDHGSNFQSSCSPSEALQKDKLNVYQTTDGHQIQQCPSYSDNGLVGHKSLDNITRTLKEFLSERDLESAKPAMSCKYENRNFSETTISKLDTPDLVFSKTLNIYSCSKQTGSVKSPSYNSIQLESPKIRNSLSETPKSKLDTPDLVFNKNLNSLSYAQQAASVQIARYDPKLIESFSKISKITKLTSSQICKLQAAFTKSHYLNFSEIGQLVKSTGLSEKIIKVWFKNNRQKHKRRISESHFQRHYNRKNYDNGKAQN